MDLSEVYLRQIDENLRRQLKLQEQQIEILTEIDRTNKEMEAYVKRINNTKYKVPFDKTYQAFFLIFCNHNAQDNIPNIT